MNPLKHECRNFFVNEDVFVQFQKNLICKRIL